MVTIGIVPFRLQNIGGPVAINTMAAYTPRTRGKNFTENEMESLWSCGV